MMMAIDNVNEYMKGATLEEFAANKMLFHAVVYNIQIIGEAAYKLTHVFCDAHPAVPWKHIISIRHIIVHGYYTLKMQGVWNIVQNDLPSLREQIAAYIAELPEDDE